MINYIEALASMQMYNYYGEYDKAKRIYEKYGNIIPSEDAYLKNRALNEYEIATKQFFLNSSPKNLQIVLFDTCNSSCIMCNQEKNKYVISEKYIKEMTDYLPYLDTLLWQGGEVFLWNKFTKMVSLIGNYKRISQSIITNCQAMDIETVKLLTSVHNIRLIISIDSVNKKNYEKIRKGSDFNKLLRNINLLNKYKESYKSNISLNINFVILKENFNEIQNIVDFAKKYNFDSVTFNECINTKDYQAEFDKNEQKSIDNNLKMAIAKAARKSLRITVQRTKNKTLQKNSGSGMVCKLPWYKLFLGEYNYFAPECTCLKKQEYGSNENIAIKDMWNSKLMQSYRKHILGIEKNEKICNNQCRLYGHYYLETMLG
ncbi:MAG: radical SAM protein [Endomicrobiaceae bacterium]